MLDYSTMAGSGHSITDPAREGERKGEEREGGERGRRERGEGGRERGEGERGEGEREEREHPQVSKSCNDNVLT